MTERSLLCRALAATIAGETTTATAASQAAIDQVANLLNLPVPECFLDAFKHRHTEIMRTLAAEIEELYAQKFDESELSETDLRWLLVVHRSPILKKFAQVTVNVLGSGEVQQLVDRVGREMMRFCEEYERERVLVN